ncbi:MAG: molybdopterin-synthase adenylyltransferase MoeB [FCB group bacterium]|nr:molybdopterin-synthase adenylyltransferase MoeB [FCB group bacterium]
MLEELFTRYPALQIHLLDESGNLRNFVNIYVNKEDIRQSAGLDTPVDEGSDIRIVPAIAGGADDLPELETGEFNRYSRHFSLPEIGVQGQRKLKAGKVLIVGTGGLGSPASLYLTAAGVGTIGLVDFDTVDESNLQRQILFGVDCLGKSKVQSARERLKALNPYVNIVTHEVALSSENALDIIKDYDIVVDGTDNFPTRYLINDACVFLGKPNVYGSIFRFEGQISVFNYDDGPCYRCLYPEPPPPGLVPSCAEGGVLGVLPGIVGSIQANEAIKLLAGIGQPLKGRFLLFDALSMEFSELKLNRNEACVVCGDNPTITDLIDYQEFCGIPSEKPKPKYGEISVQELKAKIDAGEPVTILDVRNPFELEVASIPNVLHIPMNEVPANLDKLNPEDEIIVLCRTGIRSGKICEYLINHNFKRVKNLRGGIRAWSLEIDSSVPIY